VAGQGLLQCVLHEHVVVFLLLVHLSYVLLSFADRLQISLHVRRSTNNSITTNVVVNVLILIITLHKYLILSNC